MSRLRQTVSASIIAVMAFGLGAFSVTSASPRWKRLRSGAAAQAEIAQRRVARIENLRRLGLDRHVLQQFVRSYGPLDRAGLIRNGYLLDSAPLKGAGNIRPSHRTPQGNALLDHAKDVLFGLLFGDQSTRTSFDRVQRELLTVTVPRAKASALEFMKASTELNAAGTWQDPDNASNDERADNLVIEIEYGEVKEESIGDGIVVALRLINHLEVNEQLLYARMADIEQSTLTD